VEAVAAGQLTDVYQCKCMRMRPLHKTAVHRHLQSLMRTSSAGNGTERYVTSPPHCPTNTGQGAQVHERSRNVRRLRVKCEIDDQIVRVRPGGGAARLDVGAGAGH
jgi:hypothetical protein